MLLDSMTLYTYLLLLKKNDVYISICFEYQKYTGYTYNHLDEFALISTPSHCFLILSAYSQDEILIKIILCHLAYVLYSF